MVDYFEQTILEPELIAKRAEVPESCEAFQSERLSCVAENRTAFGRVFFLIRLWVGDVMAFAGGVPGAAQDCADGAGPQLPSGCLGLDSYEGDRYVSSSRERPEMRVWHVIGMDFGASQYFQACI